MAKVVHPFFGELVTDALSGQAVIWADDYVVDGRGFEVALWASGESALDRRLLDGLAAFLQDLPASDAKARVALTAHLEEDRTFVEHHLERMQDSPVIERLSAGREASEVPVAAFVSALCLENIGLWLDASAAPVVMDYMLDPEESDEILAVKTSLDGTVLAIDWES